MDSNVIMEFDDVATRNYFAKFVFSNELHKKLEKINVGPKKRTIKFKMFDEDFKKFIKYYFFGTTKESVNQIRSKLEKKYNFQIICNEEKQTLMFLFDSTKEKNTTYAYYGKVSEIL